MGAISLLSLIAVLSASLPLTPAPVRAADPRFFPETGFRVTSDRFWEYYQRRGGSRTFGLPVSREFTLLGTRVQVFQRQVLQLRPDGSVGLLNLLDPGLMPYTTINGATFPPFDSTVIASAPTPGSSGYDQAIVRFLQQHAPEHWRGRPVKFWSTFVNTVSLQEAFPEGGGDPALLPLLALEIWGLPTSQPAFDPANPNFIYLRFQRGIMQYDATTSLTQGILLADFFKAILTGENLPADLERTARTSPFYRQYSRSAPRGLARPEALPGSDLTAAFEPEGVPLPSVATPTATSRPAEATNLTNERLKVTVGTGGAEHGKLRVHDERNELRAWAVPALILKDGTRLSLRDDTWSDGATLQVSSLNDPILGEGRQLEAEFPLKVGGSARLLATVFPGRSFLTLQIAIRNLPADRQVAGVRYFDGEPGGWLDLSAATQLLADTGELQREPLRREGSRGETHPGKPLLLSDSERKQGYVLATLDASDHLVSFHLQPAAQPVGLRLTYEVKLPAGGAASELRFPRVLIDLVPFGDPGAMLASYRRTILALYPSPPLPDWVRYQWSTAALGSELSEAAIRRQIDAIAAHFADLGPWQVVLEGEWFSLDSSGARQVDRSRFPAGLRALVDYAHERGVRVVISLPGPLVRESGGSLRWIAERQRDWLIPLGNGRSLLDFRHPAVRAWWTEVVREVLVRYDADGIRLDGYQEALPILQRANVFPAWQAAEFYRLTAEQAWAVKPTAYLEGGGYVPPSANPYLHVVRWAPTTLAFDSPPPRAGLRQHLEYTLFQLIALNQRPHLGEVGRGLREAAALSDRWLEAAAATGGLVGLTFSLADLDESGRSGLRQRLAHLQPFAGRTFLSFGPAAEVVATHRDGLAYFGFINRGAEQRVITAQLADFGLPSGAAVARDATSGTLRRVEGALTAELPPASFRLFVLRQSPGWIWTTSTLSGQAEPGALRYQLRGPASVPGMLEVVTPPPERVTLDGQLPPALSYEAALGVLRLDYDHQQRHDLRIDYPVTTALAQPARSLPR
ncbi:MAG: hypothetical protein K6U89_08185 [Chloroflexi bacterium]|nr:hypothetical protein [Chloroflexota bacterium]